MRRLTFRDVLWVAAAVGVCLTRSAPAGQLRAWGWDSDGQITKLPAGSTFMAIAAGDEHGLGLRFDGTIVAWGQNANGECVVPSGTYQAVGAGADFSLAIRSDGSIAAWGNNSDGQVSKVPTGRNFVADRWRRGLRRGPALGRLHRRLGQ